MLPRTALDDWQGKYYVSLVGFMSMDTKLKGFGALTKHYMLAEDSVFNKCAEKSKS